MHFKVNKTNVICIDYETYYSKEYSLRAKGMSTSEYIRHELFNVHCCAIKIGEQPTFVVPGTRVQAELDKIDWTKYAFLAHHAQFDGMITEHHFKIQPAFYLDTLSMSRAVFGDTSRHSLLEACANVGIIAKVNKQALEDVKGKRILTPEELKYLMQYGGEDAEATWDLFWALYPNISNAELELIDCTMKMFTRPVFMVDIPRVEAELKRELGKKASAVDAAQVPIEDLISNQKFVTLLEAQGVEIPMKISPTTGKIAPALAQTDIAFQELERHANPYVRALFKARKVSKSRIGETRALRFLEAGKEGMGLPVYLNFCGAHTHRWSGGNKLNLQNLPRPQYDDKGVMVPFSGELRYSIIAPPEHEIVVSDSSQIEARSLAWQADQMDILAEFARPGGDPYKLMASKVYGKPFDQVLKMERFIGKIAVLGLGYGMGHVKFQNTLEQGVMGPKTVISLDDAKRAVDIYRNSNYMIVGYWRFLEEVLLRMIQGETGAWKCFEYGPAYIRMPSGLFLHYQDLQGNIWEDRAGQIRISDVSYQTEKWRSKIYGGLFAENLTQAMARDIIAYQMRQVMNAGWRIATMTHDEIVCVAPKTQAPRCLDELMTIMKTSPPWCADLVLNAEGGHAENYSK